MSDNAQSFATHRRYYWPYHFVAIPILALNLIVRIVFVVRWWSWANLWEVFVAIGLIALVASTRVFALTLQNRLIRAEERARFRDLGIDASRYSTNQLIALRFCADEELPELARAVAEENLRSREAIKKRIRNWRPDTLRA
jgi:hypothetical protein